MKKIICILLVLFPLVSISFSQQHDSTAHNIKTGKALQFSIKDLLNLDSFYGSIVSYKNSFNKKLDYRIGLSLSDVYINRDETKTMIRINFQEDSLETIKRKRNEDENENQLNITLNFLIINKLKNNSNQFLYYGSGPILGYDRILSNVESFSDSDNNTNNQSDIEKIDNIYRFGLNFVLGVERYLKDNISILIEYNPSIYLRINSDKYTAKTNDGINEAINDYKTEVKSFHLNSNVRFGLSLYF